MATLSRRELLRSAPLTAAGAVLAARASGEAPAVPAGNSGLTVRSHQPQNLEMPFQELKSWVTPTEQFFVRSHFAVPKVDPAAWRLRVEGAVEKPLELTLDDVKKRPAVTRPLLLECAGNGRVFLTPPARGLQWGFGAVGNAEWTGVPLAAILDEAGVKPSAVEVVLVGAETGAIAADPSTPGPIHFDRSLPIAKARRPEVLLAYKMNGADLTASHGAPLRAVVGGWYGMAAVKWLTRVVVVEKPHAGYWQTMDYSVWERKAGEVPSLVPVTAIQPKASISRPAGFEVVPAGKPYAVTGAAWAGEEKVAKVEVSADGGKTWAAAELVGEDKPFCWRMWKYTWAVPPTAGTATLVARATDAAGRGQPDKRDPDRRTYMINHLIPVEVTVR